MQRINLTVLVFLVTDFRKTLSSDTILFSGDFGEINSTGKYRDDID